MSGAAARAGISGVAASGLGDVGPTNSQIDINETNSSQNGGMQVQN
jgi:hypothetical protein